MTLVATTEIVADSFCQPRSSMNPEVIDAYADDMTEGAAMPPLTVFHDGSTYWLADGFHRLAAAFKLGLAEIDCDIRSGDKRTAIRYSCSANATHGLRRTTADKRRAVAAMVELEPTWSDRAIAEACLVSHQTVNNYRKVSSKFDDRLPEQEPRYQVKADTPNPMESWSPPVSVAPSIADDFFDDDDGPTDLPPAVDWCDADSRAFDDVQRSMRVIDRNPKAVAYAAFGSNPIGANLVAARAETIARWYAEFVCELRKLSN